MIESSGALLRRFTELRENFDRSFAEPPIDRSVDEEDLLAISLGGDPYALRVREVHGVYVDRALTSLPLATPELVGLAAIRGELVAVYDLAVMLGYERSEPGRYLLLGDVPALGFVIGQLTGHSRVARNAVTQRGADSAGWLREVVVENQLSRPIIELSEICAHIEQRTGLELTQENT